jgi:hypothetical protein
MGARGRPSASELAVVRLQTEPGAEPPDPPAGLTGEAAQVWRDIVASLPPDWVSVANSPLMEGFCRHVAASRRVAQLIEVEEASDAFNLDDFGRLLAMQERETRAMATLATKLRLARSSVDDRRKAPKPPSGPRPWEG